MHNGYINPAILLERTFIRCSAFPYLMQCSLRFSQIMRLFSPVLSILQQFIRPSCPSFPRFFVFANHISDNSCSFSIEIAWKNGSSGRHDCNCSRASARARTKQSGISIRSTSIMEIAFNIELGFFGNMVLANQVLYIVP